MSIHHFVEQNSSFWRFWAEFGLRWRWRRFLTSRDRRMQAKLEHAVSLSESERCDDRNAETAQRTFVIEWEFNGEWDIIYTSHFHQNLIGFGWKRCL